MLGKIHIFYPGASIGVIEINPNLTDEDGALRAADEVMYQVKNNKEKNNLSAPQLSRFEVANGEKISFSSISYTIDFWRLSPVKEFS